MGHNSLEFDFFVKFLNYYFKLNLVEDLYKVWYRFFFVMIPGAIYLIVLSGFG